MTTITKNNQGDVMDPAASHATRTPGRPRHTDGRRQAGLPHDASLRALPMDCALRDNRAGTAFTSRRQKGATFRAPMAHGDGNDVADDATLDRLEGEGLVAFRYVNETGEATKAANRNGSARNIAGIFSPNLRICGLMPHPEDLVDELMGGTDGLPMFESLAESWSRPEATALQGLCPCTPAGNSVSCTFCVPDSRSSNRLTFRLRTH